MADNDTPTSGGMKKELTLFNFFTIGFGACWAEDPSRP